MNNFKAEIIKILLMAGMLIDMAYAYPPDNAAVLYYRAFIVMDSTGCSCNITQNQPSQDSNSQFGTSVPQNPAADNKAKSCKESSSVCGYNRNWYGIVKYAKGQADMDPQVKDFLRNCPATEIAMTASRIAYCDWGVNPSNYVLEPLPHLIGVRKLGYLLIADSKLSQEDGNYAAALEKCLAVKRMARHKVTTMFIVEGMTNICLDDLANQQISDLLANLSDDSKMLDSLKQQLADIEGGNRLSLKDCLAFESGVLCRPNNKINLCKMQVINDCNAKSSKGAEPGCVSMKGPDGKTFCVVNDKQESVEKNRSVYKNILNDILALWDKPYNQAYRGCVNTMEKCPMMSFVTCRGNKYSGCFADTDFKSVYTQEIKNKAYNNAIGVAIEIYLQKAKTGSLPDVLPANVPKDLFSGQDFDYMKTSDGFILQCKGKDILENDVHKYTFKTKK